MASVSMTTTDTTQAGVPARPRARMVTSPVRSAWSSPELPARAPVLALPPAVPAGVWETGGGQGLRR